MTRNAAVRLSILVLGLGLARPAVADQAADILAMVDANLIKVKDSTYDAQVEVIREGKVTKSLKFWVKLKGLQMKLVKFTAPGDVRGMAILTTDEGHMYVYLPSYQRVRRVASHVRNQGFMGTDFTPEEMGGAALSVGWSAKVLGEDADEWRLELTPKAGNETIFSKQIIYVSKKNKGVTRIESFGQGGAKIKTQSREEWRTFGPIEVPTKFTILDHTTGGSSVMTFFDCQVNQGISEETFTKRAIMRAD